MIASDTQGREVVLMGKGIGFRRKPGMEPDMSLVEKQFFGLSSGQHIQKLAKLLDRIPVVVSKYGRFYLSIRAGFWQSRFEFQHH